MSVVMYLIWGVCACGEFDEIVVALCDDKKGSGVQVDGFGSNGGGSRAVGSHAIKWLE